MIRKNVVGKLLAIAIVGMGVAACYVEAQTGGTVECNTALRRRADVESCRTRCGDEGCRTHCVEQERWSREHHCWVE